MDIWKIATAIRQRWLLFTACFLLAVGAAVLIPRAGTERVYISSAKVLLTPPSSGEYNRELTRWWFTDEATLRELATSEQLLRKVIARLRLRDDWVDLKKGIELSSASGSNFRMSAGLFQLSVETDSPEKSRLIADALVDEFVLYVQDLSAQEFANTRAFLENLVAEARSKVEETENKLLAVNSSRELAADERDVSQSQNELTTERLKLREELDTATAEAKAVEDFVSGGSSIPPWSILKEAGATSKELERAVTNHRLKLAELEQIYRPDSDAMMTEEHQYQQAYTMYETQLKQSSSALLREKNSEVQELKQRLTQVNARIAELGTKRLTLAEKRTVARLERQLTVWEESRLELVRQLYQARVSEQSSRRQGAISILERPTVGYTPKDKRLPSLARSLAVGIPFGLLFAFSMVVLVEFMTTSLRLLPRIEESLDLPILAVIPVIPPEMSRNWERLKNKEAPES